MSLDSVQIILAITVQILDIAFSVATLYMLISSICDYRRHLNVKFQLSHVFTCYNILSLLLSIQWTIGAYYNPFGANSKDGFCRGMAYFSVFAWYLAQAFEMGVAYCYYRYFKKKIKSSLIDKSHQITITKVESSEINLKRDNLETTVQENNSREEPAEKTEPSGINLEAIVTELATSQEEKPTVQEQLQAQELDRVDSLGIKCDEKPPNEIEGKTEEKREYPPEGFWAVYLLCTGAGLTGGFISALIEGHEAVVVAKCSVFWKAEFQQIGICVTVINYSLYIMFNAYVYCDLRHERKIYDIKDPHLDRFLRIFTVSLGVTIAFGFLVAVFEYLAAADDNKYFDEYLLMVILLYNVFTVLHNLLLTVLRKIELINHSERKPRPDSRQSIWNCFKKKKTPDQNKSEATEPLISGQGLELSQ